MRIVTPRPSKAKTSHSIEIGTARLSVTPPAPFHFAHNARFHGWVALAPNNWNADRQSVERVERLRCGTVVTLDISGTDGRENPGISVAVRWALTGAGDQAGPKRLPPKQRAEIKAAVRRMFRLDEDFSEFYTLCEKRRGGHWKQAPGLGRLLRSPTVFEDVVKTICTTNIQWGGTKRMLHELVAEFGEPFPGGASIASSGQPPGDRTLRAFPTPEAIALVSEKAFLKRVNMGYRGPYVHRLARQVASGDLDLERLLDPAIPTAEVNAQLRSIKGVGNYAAATLLMLLGRYDELAVDTVFREFVSKKYFAGETPPDADARKIYAKWGRWKYLAFWFDMWSSRQETTG